MRNKNSLGFYVGFSLFAIQTIVGDYYRDSIQNKMANNKIKSILSSRLL